MSEHGHEHHPADHGHDHGAMIADFRRRFWVSLALTLPVLALSPIVQRLLGVELAWSFPGDRFVLLGLSSAIFFYGGWPFLVGFFDELRHRRPGMMTLIALAISVAFFYSAAVALGLPGEVFFWEIATLIDIMLLGHWIEMRSVMGASRALEELVRLMRSVAHPDRAIGGRRDAGRLARAGTELQLCPGAHGDRDGHHLPPRPGARGAAGRGGLDRPLGHQRPVDSRPHGF